MSIVAVKNANEIKVDTNSHVFTTQGVLLISLLKEMKEKENSTRTGASNDLCVQCATSNCKVTDFVLKIFSTSQICTRFISLSIVTRTRFNSGHCCVTCFKNMYDCSVSTHQHLLCKQNSKMRNSTTFTITMTIPFCINFNCQNYETMAVNSQS